MIKAYLKRSPDGGGLILLKSWYYKPARLPLVFSTGIKVVPGQWQQTKHQAKESRRFPTSKSINGLLRRYISEGVQYIYQVQAGEGRTPDQSEVKAVLTKIKNEIAGISVTADGQATDVIKYAYSFYKRLKEDPTKSEHYAKMFKVLAGNLEAYQKARPRLLFAFHAINADWVKAWQVWNFNQGKAQNTVAGYWKRFKTVLSLAEKEGLIDSSKWNDKRLTIKAQRADEVFLTKKELLKIYNLDLSGSYLEVDRDLFLLDAFNSGHRLSDLASISKENVIDLNEAKVIKIHAAKTDTLVYSPNGWYLKEFLDKYGGGFPKMKTPQAFNRNLRKVGKLAGISQPVKLRKNKGGKNVYITKPKYEWLHQYTARISFATNLAIAGLPIQDISKLMGHSNIKQTEGYIKAEQLHAAINASNNSFFQKPAAAAKVVK